MYDPKITVFFLKHIGIWKLPRLYVTRFHVTHNNFLIKVSLLGKGSTQVVIFSDFCKSPMSSRLHIRPKVFTYLFITRWLLNSQSHMYQNFVCVLPSYKFQLFLFKLKIDKRKLCEQLLRPLSYLSLHSAIPQ